MKVNAKRPVSAHHTFRAKIMLGGLKIGWGGKFPLGDFGRGIVVRNRRKSKKLPVFLLQNITWLRTSNCDAVAVQSDKNANRKTYVKYNTCNIIHFHLTIYYSFFRDTDLRNAKNSIVPKHKRQK